MKNPGMAKVWRDLAEDNRALLKGIRDGRSARSYSAAEIGMLEAEAMQFETLADEYETVEHGREDGQPRPIG